MGLGCSLVAGPPRSGPACWRFEEVECRVVVSFTRVLGTVPETPRQASRLAGRGGGAQCVCTFQSSWTISGTPSASWRLAGVFWEGWISPPQTATITSNALHALELCPGVETSFYNTQLPFSHSPAAWECSGGGSWELRRDISTLFPSGNRATSTSPTTRPWQTSWARSKCTTRTPRRSTWSTATLNTSTTTWSRLTLKMWLQNQKGHTVSMAFGRPALPPSLWRNTGFTACCLPSLASQWRSSGAFTSPFSLSCTSGQLYHALRASWLRFSASAVSIPSTSTPSVTHSLKLLGKYSAMSASTCRKKYEWHFKDRSIPDFFSF